MKAIFKCQKCEKTFSQSIELYGLMVYRCGFCNSLFMDCQNLEECLQWLEDRPPSIYHINKEKRYDEHSR